MSNETKTPDWATAPRLSNWFAIDADGTGYWHKSKPILIHDKWKPYDVCIIAGKFDATNWKKSLQRNPLNG